MFTDGVTESRDADENDLGSQKLVSAVTPLHGSDAETIAAAVNDTVLQHVGENDELDDDVTLLVVSRS